MSVQEKAALVQGTGKNLVVKVRGVDRLVRLIKSGHKINSFAISTLLFLSTTFK